MDVDTYLIKKLNQVINIKDMKVLIVLTLLVAVSNAELSKEFVEKFEKDLKTFPAECVIQENASQDDLMEFTRGSNFTRKEGKCLAACVGEKFGIIKDEKLSLDGGLKAIEPMKNQDADIYNKVKQILEKCVAEGNAGDRCDTAVKFINCIVKIGNIMTF